MPPRRTRPRWWPALAWLLLSAATVAAGVLFVPRIGAGRAAEGPVLPVDPGSTTVAELLDAAVPMAATVLYPNELAAPPAPPAPAKN